MKNAHKIAEKDVKEGEQRTIQENQKLKKDLEVHQKELDY